MVLFGIDGFCLLLGFCRLVCELFGLLAICCLVWRAGVGCFCR